MQIREGAYYRARNGRFFGPMGSPDFCERYPWVSGILEWDENGRCYQTGSRRDEDHDLISEVYVSDTPPSDDVMLNLSEIARTKSKALGEGNFGMDDNPPCGIRLRWLVEVVDNPSDTPIFRASNPFIHPAPDGPNGPFRIAPETKTLRDEFAMALMDADDFMVGFKEHAEQLYRAADAMMEARNK